MALVVLLILLIVYILIVIRCIKRKRVGILFLLTGIALFCIFHLGQISFEAMAWNPGIFPYDSNGNYLGDMYRSQAERVRNWKYASIIPILIGIVFTIKEYFFRHKKDETTQDKPQGEPPCE